MIKNHFITTTRLHLTMADSARARDPRSESSKDKDLISRGDYTKTPGGKLTFFLGRAIDPFVQYSILAHGAGTGLLHQLGLRTLPPGLPAHTGIAAIDALGLSPYRLVLLGMALGSVVKQNIWVTYISGEPMPVKGAILVGLFNLVFNSLNSYAFLVRATSASMESSFPQPALLIGSGLYVTGILVELIAEIQRKHFKDDPKNKGKPFIGGLWSFARHISTCSCSMWTRYILLTSHRLWCIYGVEDWLCHCRWWMDLGFPHSRFLLL
jgi:hypothetical protein